MEAVSSAETAVNYSSLDSVQCAIRLGIFNTSNMWVPQYFHFHGQATAVNLVLLYTVGGHAALESSAWL
jgi:hypothetical protein